MDAYGAEEQAMGWYGYLEEHPRFPFPAKCNAQRAISPLRKGQEVEVVGLAPAGECDREMFITLAWEQRTLAVPLAQLEPIRADKMTPSIILLDPAKCTIDLNSYNYCLNQLLDAFHIWCAEHKYCEYFLTLDYRLIRLVSNHKFRVAMTRLSRCRKRLKTRQTISPGKRSAAPGSIIKNAP